MQALADEYSHPAIAVQVEELLQALVAAEGRFGAYINKTPDKAAAVAQRASGLFAAVEPEMLTKASTPSRHQK